MAVLISTILTPKNWLLSTISLGERGPKLLGNWLVLVFSQKITRGPGILCSRKQVLNAKGVMLQDHKCHLEETAAEQALRIWNTRKE